jgi:hypothetical protein
MKRLIALTYLILCAAAEASGVTLGTLPSPKHTGIVKEEGSLPLIVSPITPATVRINASLVRVNEAWRKFKEQCFGERPPKDMNASRSVEVTMNGTNYLSLVVKEQWYCPGTAHPDHDSIALVYDLRTGRPLNWHTVLPRRLISKSHVDVGMAGQKIGHIASPDLDKLFVITLRRAAYRSSSDWWSECEDIISDPSLDFIAWPDDKRGGIVIEPVGLAYAVENCEDDALVSTAVLRSLGASRAFVGELELAHKAKRAYR